MNTSIQYTPVRRALHTPLHAIKGCCRRSLSDIGCFMLTLLFGLLLLVSLSSGKVLAQETDSVDLVTVYEAARQHDAEFQTALFDLEAARANIPLAKSRFRPQLSLRGEAAIAQRNDDGQGTYEETAFTLALSQSIYNRADSKTLDQANISVQQAQAQYAAVEQTLILRVADAYFDVLRAENDVEFSQSELEAIRRQLEQAERRFDVGLVPITDVRTAQAQFDLAVAQEIAASNQLSTAQEELLRISGIDSMQLAPLAEDLPLTSPEPADISQWVDLALEQNLELVIAELSMQSSALQISIERAASYPTLDLVGSATAFDTDSINSRDTESAELALQLALPIYTGGAIKASVAQAKATARATEQQLLSQKLTTTQQTRDAYRGVLASISSVRALRQALVSTQQSAEATEAGFRAGTRTSVEVLQALRDTFGARSEFASARYDFVINTLSLKAASGILSEDDLAALNRFLAAPEDNS